MNDLMKTVTVASATAKDWLRALTVAGPGISRRPPVPILGAVLITPLDSQVSVESFNYETSTRTLISGDIQGDSAFCVWRNWLQKAIKTTTGRKTTALVTVTASGKKVTVESCGYTLVADCVPADEYPELPAHEAPSVTIATDQLKAAIKRASAVVSLDDTLPLLTTIQLSFGANELDLWATDRYRLVTEAVSCKNDHEFSVLLKARNLMGILPKLEDDVTVLGCDAERVTIRSGRNTFTDRAVDGEYPKVASLFPTEPKFAFEVDRRVLLESALVAVEMSPPHTPCKVVATNDGATVTFSDGLWEESKAPKAVGRFVQGSDKHVLAFNPSYLAQALKSISGERVRVSGTQPDKPWVFTEAGVDATENGVYRHLLMPVRMSS